MITNINELQNITYGSGLTTYSDLYIKQSLANLGQRYSIKGDGLQNGEFHIYDLLLRDYDEIQNANSLANVKITENESTGGVDIVLAYIDNNNIIEQIPLAGLSYYTTSEDIHIDGSPINNVEYYKSGGIIYKTDDYYTTTFAGVSSNEELVDITCDSFVISNDKVNQIHAGLKIRQTASGLRLYHVYNNPSSHLIDKEYILDIYSFSTEFTNMKTIYDKLFSKDTTGENIIYGHEKETDPEYIVKSLLDNDYITLISHIDNVVSNTDDSQYLYFSGGDVSDKEYLNMFAYDANSFYEYIKTYYNSHVFFTGDDNMSLKKQLLVSLVTKIYEDYLSSCIYDEVKEYNLWFPYNYKFVYSCNSNNPAIIYNSVKNVSVRYSADVYEIIPEILGKDAEQIIICDSTDSINIEDRFVVYQYSITYDKDNNVDDIIVEKTYTLPYINNKGYWCINDITTSIYAKGKDGGQPNIVITYTNTYTGQHQVLSSFKRDELTNLDWSLTKYMIKPLDNDNNTEKYRHHILYTYMPTNISYLNENLITLLESALILNVNSVNSEILNECTNTSYLYEDLGTDGVVPTFWILNKKLKSGRSSYEVSDYEYSFTYVKQPGDEWAVDMNYLTNAEDIVKHYMQFGIEPDNYEHSWIVFDKKSTDLKNSTNEKASDVWPVIKNFSKDELVQEYGNYDSGDLNQIYNNELNMFVGFFDHVTKTEGTGYINGISQYDESRYFRLDKYGKTSSVINYAKYKDEWIPNAHYVASGDSKVLNGLVPILDLSEVFVRNNSVLNRINIVSADEYSNMFNAYFGVSFDSPVKSTIHLGTSNTNINIGNMTMLFPSENSYFQKHSELSIDFDAVTINGTQVSHGPIWTKTDGPNNSTLYSTIASPEQVGNSHPISLNPTYPGNPDDVNSNIEDARIMNATNSLLSYSYYVGFAGSLRAPKRIQKQSWLNLTYYLNNVLGMGIITASNDNYARFHGDKVVRTSTAKDGVVHYVYFLQLSTDITSEESSLMTNNSGARNTYYITNPISITYYTGIPFHFTVRELSTTSDLNAVAAGVLK